MRSNMTYIHADLIIYFFHFTFYPAIASEKNYQRKTSVKTLRALLLPFSFRFSAALCLVTRIIIKKILILLNEMLSHYAMTAASYLLCEYLKKS